MPYTRRRGWTLVELMIVVIISLMILAIAAPNLMTARAVSRARTVCSDLREIDEAKQQYLMSNELTTGEAVNNGSVLVPSYMNVWPTGPIPGTYDANSVGTDPTFNGEPAVWYTLHCTGSTADSACPF